MADALPVEIRDLSVTLNGQPILRGIDWSVREGSFAALLGPNGAGKSTLLRALAGLTPAEGSVRLFGRELRHWSRRELAATLSWVPQQSALRSPMPVWRVVAQGRYPHLGALGRLRGADCEKIAAALASVDAEHLSSRWFPTLSGGEKRRVLIARALATEAPLIVLDEPTASLDIEHRLRVLGLIRQLCEAGQTAVVVLHELEEAQRFADDVLVLDRGGAVGAGSPQSVLSDEVLSSVYGVRRIERVAPRYELLDDGGER